MRVLVYDSANLARRRLLHRRIAAALQSRARGPAGEASASLIGYHFRLGGQDAAAADYYRRAGDHARALYANREALDHYQTALALGHPDAAELHEAVADLCTLLGEYGAALQAYESAAALAPETALGRLEHKLGQVYERRGNWELAESHFRRALESRNTLGILARHEGDPAAAREQLERSLALAEAGDMVAARVAALNNLAGMYEAEGQTDAALALLDQAIDLCVRQGDRHHEAALYNHRADVLHRAGQEAQAMDN
jgi:tetratricopeptide (TPR) repeat protein